MASITGVDISAYQPTYNLPAFKAAGNSFVIIKVTEGTNYVSPTWGGQWAAAEAAGLVRGLYHFARPEYGNSPQAEANYFWGHVGSSLKPGDFLALDIETGVGNLNKWVADWLYAISAAAGFKPFIYSYLSFFAAHGLTSGLSQYGLWLADRSTGAPHAVSGWPFTAMWQNAVAGAAGFPGAVDHDIFYGTVAQLQAYGKPHSAPAPPPLPPPPPPVDPCADKDQQIATLSNQIVALTQRISNGQAKINSITL